MSMAQNDIVEVLKEKRLSGDDAFYSVNEIKDFLVDYGKCGSNHVYGQVKKLHLYGVLTVHTTQKENGKPWLGWNRKYRYRLAKEAEQLGGLS